MATISHAAEAYNGYYVDNKNEVTTRLFEGDDISLVDMEIEDLFLESIEFEEVEGEPGLFEGTLYAHEGADQLPVCMELYSVDHLIKPLFRLNEEDAEELREAMQKQSEFPVKFNRETGMYSLHVW